MEKINKKDKGFTLIEMSVVLVIIGLISMTVIYGKEMLRQSQSKVVLSEIEVFTSAFEMFKTKYSYKPGDVPSADRYFTGDAVDLTEAANRGNDAWDTSSERDIMWPQLYQAELIQQRTVVDADPSMPGTNRPESKVEGGGWTIVDTYTVDPPGTVTAITFYNALRFGGADNSTEYLGTGILSVADHIYIDGKIDAPNTSLTGSYVVGMEDNDCAREISAAIYGYALDSESVKCTGNIVNQ